MQTDDNILDLLRKEAAEAAKKAQRGLIVQPGAIGDCILTLPLAGYMKEALALGGIDFLGHTEYIGFLPGRTCIDGVSSIDSIELHRLFAEPKAFDLADGDPLINALAGYSWIATFLGEPNSNFEQNLIFAANCSHSAEVITLSMKPPKAFSEHLTDFYIQQFITQSGVSSGPQGSRAGERLIKATKADTSRGRELLQEAGLGRFEKLVVIQPGSGGLRKCWHLDNFLAVTRELSSSGIEVVFLLGPAEVDRFSQAKIKSMRSVARCLMDLSLTQVLGLLNCADGFIGNDSGITHLAAGLGIRTLAAFGPTKSAVYRPIGPAVTVLENSPRTFAKKPSMRSQQKLLDALMPQANL